VHDFGVGSTVAGDGEIAVGDEHLSEVAGAAERGEDLGVDELGLNPTTRSK
jgi:hypothetical protein